MTLQIFPERFYTTVLSDERIGVTWDGRFEILPPESLRSRLWRFLTFQQDLSMIQVHDKLKGLSLQRSAENLGERQLPDLRGFDDEIRAHGEIGCRRLRRNIGHIQSKLHKMGRMNCFSTLVLKLINVVRAFFCIPPIRLTTYIRPVRVRYHEPGDDEHWDWRQEPSFDISHLSIRTGVQPTPIGGNTCRFSANDFRFKNQIQDLEKGLMSCWPIRLGYKTYDRSEKGLTVVASLEISFDSQRQCFLATVKHFWDKPSHLGAREPTTFGPVEDLLDLPDDRKTVRYFASAVNPQGVATEHELNWFAEPNAQPPLGLHVGPPLVLEPETQYTFYGEQRQKVFALKITLNRPANPADPAQHGLSKATTVSSNQNNQREGIMATTVSFARNSQDVIEELSELLICPTSWERLRDPVIDPCGHTFERADIIQMLEISQTCPLSRNPLEVRMLTSNLIARNAVDLLRRLEGQVPFAAATQQLDDLNPEDQATFVAATETLPRPYTRFYGDGDFRLLRWV